MKRALLDFLNTEITERRDYSASKSFEIVKEFIEKYTMKKKTKRGGKRPGAGRKKKEETTVMRVPKSKVEDIKQLIKHMK